MADRRQGPIADIIGSYNSGTASRLLTARLISGELFDGTADIVIAANGLSNGVTGSGRVVLQTGGVLGPSTMDQTFPAGQFDSHVTTNSYSDWGDSDGDFGGVPVFTVRLTSGYSDVPGTYYNGPGNDGVDATLTIGAATLTVDGKAVANGDRLFLPNQTTVPVSWGIYTAAGVGVNVVLTRATDFDTPLKINPNIDSNGNNYVKATDGNSNSTRLWWLGNYITNIGVDTATGYSTYNLNGMIPRDSYNGFFQSAGQIWVADSDAVMQPVSVSGDASLSDTGELTVHTAAACTGNAATATTAGNLSGAPALPNGTTATTQSAVDGTDKLATCHYADRVPAAAGGISVTITTAALTTLGTQGSMTFVNGLLTASTPAT